MHVMMENKRHTFVFNDKDSENKETLNLESQNINNKNSNNNTLDYENETSETIRNRVINARKIQKERYQNYKISLNSEVDGKLLHEICLPKDKNTIEMLNVIADKLEISMRGMTKILRVARTIADLSNSENVLRHHILEAASYRKKLGGNEKVDS